jgi:Cdc6-like AAA superfamily ATPase
MSEKILEKATDLKGIMESCNPKHLRESEIDDFYVETESARGAYCYCSSELKTYLFQDSIVKILFVGNRGSGKTTLINKLITEMRKDFLIVKFSASDYIREINFNLSDCQINIYKRIFEVAQENEIPIDDIQESDIQNWVTEMNQTIILKDSNETKFSAGFKLHNIIGFGHSKKQLQETKTEIKKPVYKDFRAFREHLEVLIQHIEKFLPNSKKILLII